MIKLIPQMVYALNIRKGYKKIANFERLTENAPDINKQLMLSMLAKNADTEYGKRYHFGEITTIEEYQQKVPFSIYDDYAPYIERMIAGEKDLLTKDNIVHYAL